MTENKINGLALININKKEVILEDEVVEDFAKTTENLEYATART